ncbi:MULTISPECIES: aspartate/glutamate racemase family protein [unclassified Streptomyces]|uniref:maleate cis-trans isomerase family protein n=1 Tax=unclassified Streptomyces TaxID=2593676 RepID=UPI00136DFCEA|nr:MULTISPECIES: aspartate/glutamate racemase family protein [unclassified Streptomyces]MCW5251844.1 aspartate/glutamate racemase family protein [Streptomyces sp. SHP 1-2]MYU22175.1 decarboxylase [Streptomyces sp. SID8352]
MTALGFLYPGHLGEDDYPRMEQLLGGDVRVDLVHTDIDQDAHEVDALRELGTPERITAGVEELRLSGADAVVWACTSGGFVHGWQGAREQVRALARAAGMPASSTSFAFAHAAREIGAPRVAVGAPYTDDVAELFADFLRAGGLDVTSVAAFGPLTEAGAAAGDWGAERITEMARAADHPEADAVLLPDNALPTVAHIPELEKELGKPVLTANQVAVWEALRLSDRRVNAPRLGALFTREPLVQA